MQRNREKNMFQVDHSRRDFIKAAALSISLSSALNLWNPNSIVAAAQARIISLSMAGYNFDRTRALVEGKVKVEGYKTQFAESGIGDLNTDVFSGPQSYDVTEIGLHPYILAFANDEFTDYLLLPIFPLRLFRHKSVFIRTDRGIDKPQDLRGKKIATAGYSSTSLTWIRVFSKINTV